VIDRNELFVTIRDNKGELLDPVSVTCSVKGGPEYLPERLSKGIYLVSKSAVPAPDGYVIWRIKEKTEDPIRETNQASDGGIYYKSVETNPNR
jgi:hypothetical protein